MRRGSKGVRKGYTHIWTYRGPWKERKIGPGTWKVAFRATKSKKHSGRGGPAIGAKIHWRFSNVHQYAVKTGRGRYQTILLGTKHLVKMKGYRGRRRR